MTAMACTLPCLHASAFLLRRYKIIMNIQTFNGVMLCVRVKVGQNTIIYLLSRTPNLD